MEAVFVNSFQGEPAPTPLQVVEGFLDVFPADLLGERLLGVYRLAVLGGLVEGGDGSKGLSAEEVALLFDQLVNLAGALTALRQEGGARYLSVLGGRSDV